MPSPFPGMDPYLEAHWGDVHSSLVLYARDQLQPVLPQDLRARVEERLVVTAESDYKRSIQPDVRVFEGRLKRRRPAKDGGVMLAEPMVIELDGEPKTQRFLEIREASAGSRLITVVEVLSPSNKAPGKTRAQYRQKQEELLEAGVSLVEIDLLRGGDWVVAVPRDFFDAREETPYRVVVRRGWRTAVEYYPLSLRDKLPAIRIPLREADEDAPLDLQALIAHAYDNGAYDDIDYTKEPQPPLEANDARWADRLLRRAGLRGRRKARKKP